MQAVMRERLDAYIEAARQRVNTQRADEEQRTMEMARQQMESKQEAWDVLYLNMLDLLPEELAPYVGHVHCANGDYGFPNTSNQEIHIHLWDSAIPKLIVNVTMSGDAAWKLSDMRPPYQVDFVGDELYYDDEDHIWEIPTFSHGKHLKSFYSLDEALTELVEAHERYERLSQEWQQHQTDNGTGSLLPEPRVEIVWANTQRDVIGIALDRADHGQIQDAAVQLLGVIAEALIKIKEEGL